MILARAILLLILLAVLDLSQGCAVAFNVAIGNTTAGALPVSAPELGACRPLDRDRPLP
jgi:hypothetical protein